MRLADEWRQKRGNKEEKVPCHAFLNLLIAILGGLLIMMGQHTRSEAFLLPCAVARRE
jgi:hypothetical protein